MKRTVQWLPTYDLGTPLRRLWTAVLEEAKENAQGSVIAEQNPSMGRDRAIGLARKWFRSMDIDAGSFLWVCHVLDLEPIQIRTAILNAPQKPASTRKSKYLRRIEREGGDYRGGWVWKTERVKQSSHGETGISEE